MAPVQAKRPLENVGDGGYTAAAANQESPRAGSFRYGCGGSFFQ